MSTNLYRINDWTPATAYVRHDVVKKDGYYFYCKLSHTSISVFAGDSDYWFGYKFDAKGISRPLFDWLPSYNSSVNMTPRVKRIQFGDGYEQRVADGINNDLLEIDVTFDNRSQREAHAINHFLRTRKGVEAFLFTPAPPYAERKLFTCEQWQNVLVFFDNHSIKARFLEKVN